MSGFLISNSGGGGGTPTGPAGGDLGGSYPNPSVLNINGVVISGTPASGNIIVASGPTAASWTTAPSGFTAGGDLSGTNTSQTVIRINGTTVPAGGSLTTGNQLIVSGSAAATWQSLNLAGGANFVTGLLPVGNQANQNMAGDVTGTTAASVVTKLQGNAVKSGTNGASQDGYVLTWVNSGSDYEVLPLSGASVNLSGDVTGTTNNNKVISISGSSGVVNVASTGNIFTWAAATTAPGLAQTAAVSGAGANLTIAPQAATTSGTSGSLLINLSAPASGTTEATVQIKRGAVITHQFGAINTNDTTFWMYPISSNITPTNNNPVLQILNSGRFIIGGGVTNANLTQIELSPSSTQQFTVQSNTILMNGLTFLNSGGIKVVDVNNATTIPTALVSGATGLTWYSNAGNFEIDGYGFGFHKLVPSPQIYQTAATSDVAPQNITIAPQGPFASASTAANKTPGSLTIQLATLVAGGGTPAVECKYGSTTSWAMGPDIGSPTTITQLWLDPSFAAAGTRGASNANLIATAGRMIVNGGTQLEFQTNNVEWLLCTSSGTLVTLFNGSSVLTGLSGAKVIGMANATSVPSTLISGTGLSFYSNSGNFELDGYGFGFNALVPSPSIYQTAAASGAGVNMTVAPQAATTTGASGSLLVNLSAPASGTTEAYLQVQRAGSTLLQLGAQVGSLTSGAIYPPSATPSSTNYCVSATNAGTTYNGINHTYLGVNGSIYVHVNSTPTITFFSGSTPISGSGSTVVGLANATVVPSALVSGATGLTFYSQTGNFEIDGYGFGFNALVPSPSHYQTTGAAGSIPQSMSISPQAPNASSATTASGTPGSLLLNYAAPVSTGVEAYVQVQRAGSTLLQLGALVGTLTSGAIYPPGVTPSATNYSFNTGGNATLLNGVFHTYLACGNTIALHLNSSPNIQLFSGSNMNNAGGTNVLCLANASVIPNALLSGATGLVAYGQAGNFEIDGYGFGFNALVPSPQIYQTAAASGAGQSLTAVPQAATTTGASGSLVVNLAVPASGTTEAALQISRGGTAFGTLAGGASNIPVAGGTGLLIKAAGTNQLGIQTTNQALVISSGTTTTYLQAAGINIYDGSTVLGGSITPSSHNLTLNCGTGNLVLQNNGTTQLTFSATSLQPAQSAIALTATTITLSAGQQKTPSLVFSGTPGAGTCTIALNGVVGMYWLDFSQVTLGATTFIITNGAGTYTATTILATKTMLCVVANTTSTLSVG